MGVHFVVSGVYVPSRGLQVTRRLFEPPSMATVGANVIPVLLPLAFLNFGEDVATT